MKIQGNPSRGRKSLKIDLTYSPLRRRDERCSRCKSLQQMTALQ